MVLDRHREEHPRPVAAIRLPTLTGARLSEVINLKWDEIGELGKHDAGGRIEDSQTGPARNLVRAGSDGCQRRRENVPARRRIELHAGHPPPLATTDKGLAMAQFCAATTGPPGRLTRSIIPPPLTDRIFEEILYRVEIYQSFPVIAVRIPAYSKSVIKANATFFKFRTVPECLRRRLAICGRKRRVDTACHPGRHGHRFRRRDPLL